jgi:hypothetical protein
VVPRLRELPDTQDDAIDVVAAKAGLAVELAVGPVVGVLVGINVGVPGPGVFRGVEVGSGGSIQECNTEPSRAVDVAMHCGSAGNPMLGTGVLATTIGSVFVL